MISGRDWRESPPLAGPERGIRRTGRAAPATGCRQRQKGGSSKKWGTPLAGEGRAGRERRSIAVRTRLRRTLTFGVKPRLRRILPALFIGFYPPRHAAATRENPNLRRVGRTSAVAPENAGRDGGAAASTLTMELRGHSRESGDDPVCGLAPSCVIRASAAFPGDFARRALSMSGGARGIFSCQAAHRQGCPGVGRPEGESLAGVVVPARAGTPRFLFVP